MRRRQQADANTERINCFSKPFPLSSGGARLATRRHLAGRADRAELVAAGWSADVTAPGAYTWTFADGRATIEVRAADGSGGYCEADMTLAGGNVRLNYSGFDCGDEGLSSVGSSPTADSTY